MRLSGLNGLIGQAKLNFIPKIKEHQFFAAPLRKLAELAGS